MPSKFNCFGLTLVPRGGGYGRDDRRDDRGRGGRDDYRRRSRSPVRRRSRSHSPRRRERY